MISSVLLTLGLLGISAGLFYVFLVWNFNYWKKRGVKGPTPTAFYGTLPSMVKQNRNMCYDLDEIYKRYCDDEDFVGLYSIRTPQLMIIDPQMAHNVFVKDFKNFRNNEAAAWVDEKGKSIFSNNPFVLRDENWKTRRQEISPGLTASRIKAVYGVTQEVCERLRMYIKAKCLHADKDGIDAKDLCLRFTSDVVTDCVLGVKADSLTENPSKILDMTKRLFDQTFSFRIYAIIAGFWPTIRRFYKVKFFKQETEDFFFSLMSKAFDLRRKKSVDRVDFINYILQLQDKKHLSNQELTSHSMTFLIDGFETSASVIVHCLYQLAKYPEAQEKLIQEILANIDGNGKIDFEKLHELPYLDQCIYESMRITSPQTHATKLCTEVCELTNKNGKKLQVNPDDIVLIPVYCFHHDERFFPNPEEFIPERFDPSNGGVKKFREMGVFYPFGEGPRICLGMKFALTQVKAAVVEIVKNFHVKLNSKTRTDNIIDPIYIIGTLDGGVWLNFESRE